MQTKGQLFQIPIIRIMVEIIGRLQHLKSLLSTKLHCSISLMNSLTFHLEGPSSNLPQTFPFTFQRHKPAEAVTDRWRQLLNVYSIGVSWKSIAHLISRAYSLEFSKSYTASKQYE